MYWKSRYWGGGGVVKAIAKRKPSFWEVSLVYYMC